jgi:uncharacterized protein with von Willebrand factor type A (vWA) domain
VSGRLLGNLLRFGSVLRGLGLDAGPARMIGVARALEHVSIGNKSDFHDAARSLLVRRREDLAIFDRAFDAFWRKPSGGETPLDLRALGEQRRWRRPAFAPPEPQEASRAADAPGPDPPAPAVVLTYSPAEALRHKDFGQLTGEELTAVRASIAGLAWRLAVRRTRRTRPGHGRLPDLRRTLRRALASGGEVVIWARRERKTRPRPLVVLADISGSMERYTRLVVLFLYALAEGLDQSVEVFAFGTRLTRITKELAGRDAEQALARAARAVPDWSGGTRIGESLKAFNYRWARRVLSRGAAVIVISDGWDRGEPQLLAREMARLQRSAHRVIWLNPLLGAPRYEPLARGIRAALPFVDDFLPVHNLASLEDLARRLEALPRARAARRQAPAAAGA